MPSLNEATQPLQGNYERVEVPATALTPPPFVNPDVYYSIKSNMNLLCPAPPINVSPDNLRQYYRGGQVPQSRVLSPPTLTAQSSGTTVSSTTVVSSSSTTTTTALPTLQTTGIATPSLIVGQVYTTIMQIAKSFEIQRFGVNAPCWIRLYSTAATQNADSSRPLGTPIVTGIQNGLIAEIQFITSNEFSFLCSNKIPGFNGDSPQSTAIYLTVVNTGSSASVVSLTVNYVQIES